MTEQNLSTGEASTPAASDVDQRIAKIVDDYVSQLQAGQLPDRCALEQQHSDLSPVLGSRLALAERIFLAAKRGGQSDTRGATGEPASAVLDDKSAEATSLLRESSLPSDIQAERAWRLRCPHCGNPIQVVDTNQAEITCRVCGSSFHYDSNATATYVPAKHPKSIGRFQVQNVLGRGAFGVVYKAYDTELRRVVAIKVPRAGHFVQSEEKERFLREARSVARLRHDQIVQVHEVLHENGVPCIVSDFVDGLTLGDIASGRRVSFREAADYVARAADALNYAHDAGVIHRDVKPSNILVDHAGRLFLTDFGLARQDDGEITMTVDGEVIGTPAYMSPEQAVGRLADIDRRSDVYSLGVVLYRLLSGELPFRGSRRMTIYQVIHEEPRSLRTMNEHVPRDLETIALKAMSKESAKRYATARELADDLRRWLRGEPIRARPVGRIERLWRWSRRHRLVASLTATIVALLVLSAVAGTVWAIRERGLRREADIAREQESRERARADANAHTNRQRLARLRRTQGTQRLSESDFFGSLVWYISAMDVERENSSDDAMDRLRLGTILAQCPKLAQLWTHARRVDVMDVSANGRYVLSASDDGLVQVWNAATDDRAASMRHAARVRSAAFSPDGERVVSASADKTVILWSIADPPVQQRLLPHTEVVNAVAFSPDGRFAATACHDQRVRLWDTVTGDLVAESAEHDGGVNGLTFHPEGTLLLTTTSDVIGRPGEARLWEVPTLAMHGQPIKSVKTVFRAVFSPSGKSFLTCGHDGTARVWDVATGEPVTPPLVHLGAVRDGLFSPDGTHVVTAGSDGAGAGRIWNSETGEPVGTPLRHAGGVIKVAISRDGQYLATAGNDGGVRVWNTRTQELVCPPLPHAGTISGLAFDPTNRRLVSAGGDEAIRVWDLPSDAVAYPLLRHDRSVVQVVFAPDGRHVLTASNDKTARWWDIETGAATRLEHDGEVLDAKFSPVGDKFATACVDGLARIGDARTGQWLPLRMNHEASVRGVAFNPLGDRLVTYGNGRWAKIWDTSTGALLASLEHPEIVVFPGQDIVHHASFSPDGQLVATAGEDHLVRIWRADTGAKAREPLEHRYAVRGCVFSPDGRQLLTYASSLAFVWNLETGQNFRLDHHEQRVSRVGFSHDGRWIATASQGTVAVWDAKTGQQKSTPLNHGNASIHTAVFNLDDHLLATGSGGRQPFSIPGIGSHGAGQVWDPATADPITPPLRNGDQVARVAFNSDSHKLVTGGIDGMVKVWKLEPDNRPLDDLRMLAELLAGRRVDEVSGLVPLTTDELQSRWNQLRHKHPESFTSSPAAVAAWDRGDN